jgi:hypothetical protein
MVARARVCCGLHLYHCLVQQLFFFKCFHINSKKNLLASSCLFFRQSDHVLQRGSHCTEFREILYCGLLRKSVEKLQIWLKSDTKSGFFMKRLKYVHIVDSSRKYFVAKLQRKRNPSLRFPWTHSTVVYCSPLHLGQQ